MAKFDIGETVICSTLVKNSSGTLTDPATSMNIVINCLKPTYSADVVSSTAMTNDSTGTYHYDFASAGEASGKYQSVCTATDGARISIQKETFTLE